MLDRSTRTRGARRALAVAAVMVALLSLTLGPIDPPPPGVQLWEWCRLCGEHWGVDFIGNVALFVPLGLVLRHARVPLGPALIGTAAFTFLIEVAQLFIRGRITSVDDLIANVVGGLLGYAIAVRWRTLLDPSPRQAREGALGSGVLVLAIVSATLWLFGPAAPPPPYTGQFSPALLHFGQIRGTILEASVGREPLTDGVLSNSAAVHAELELDSLTVRAIVRGGTATRRLAPVVRLVDADGREILLLGKQDAYSLHVRFRSRASVVGLHTPNITISNAFPSGPDAASRRVQLIGWRAANSIGAEASYDAGDGAPHVASGSLRLRPTEGWAYLLGFERLARTGARRLTIVWLSLVFLPLGYFAGAALPGPARGRARAGIVGWTAAVVIGAMVVVPGIASSGAADAAEWLGAGLGLLGGGAVAWILRPLSSRRSG